MSKTVGIDNFFFDKETGFLCYSTTPEDLKEARDKHYAKFRDSNILNSKSISDRKESKMTGIIGEIAFCRYLEHKKFPYKHVGDQAKSYDFLVCKKGVWQAIDVKCKYRTVQPTKHLDASILQYQFGDFWGVVDMYVFMSTMSSYEYVWFCGQITKDQWMNNPNGKLWKAGEIDHSNEKQIPRDMWNILYGDLPQFDVKKYLSSH